MLEYITDGSPWNGERIEGVRYSRGIERSWSVEELSAIVLRVREIPEVVIPHAQRIKDANLKVVAYADNLGDLITGTVPMDEKESWTKKEVAARKYVANPGSLSSYELDLLQNDLDVTADLDKDLATLSDKIIEMADLFTDVAGKIAGLRRVSMTDRVFARVKTI